MKKVLLIFIFLLAINITNVFSFAEDKTIIVTGGFDVPNTWSFEYYIDAKILYSDEVPFNITEERIRRQSAHVMADGREYNDGKNDVGMLCRTNLGITWYLKIHATPSNSPLITLANIQYYFGLPWNRSFNPPWNGAPADGTLIVDPPDWVNLPSVSTAIYEAGERDKNNLPGGTLCLFSFALDPSKLSPTEVYNCTIHYTLTATP